jgi:hypothetical protein
MPPRFAPTEGLRARVGLGDFPRIGDEVVTYEPAHAECIIRDGDRVTLGGVTLTAQLTPGHLQGCTTWTLVVKENKRHAFVIVPIDLDIDAASERNRLTQEFIRPLPRVGVGLELTHQHPDGRGIVGVGGDEEVGKERVLGRRDLFGLRIRRVVGSRPGWRDRDRNKSKR